MGKYIGNIINLTGYTPYTPAAGGASPGIWKQSDLLTFTQNRQINMYDPRAPYNVLLLNGNGTNGAQNNTFLVTPPGGVGQYTGSFNGSSQSLSVANNAALSLSTGDFTIEAWIYLSSTSKYSVVSSATTTARGYAFEVSTTLLGFNVNNGGSNTGTVSYSGAISQNVWHHIVACRSGTTTRLFVDGTQVASGTLADQDASTTNPVYVGAQNYTGFPQYFNGYISNVRIVKGTAVYTAAFTPPTLILTPIPNTSLLTCQSATFIDNSPNNFTITNNGSTTIVNPNTFPVVTRIDTTTQGSFSPYGLLWSNYFNGSTDYLTAAVSSAGNAFGTNSFTVEGWIYLTSAASTQYIADARTTGLWAVGFGLGGTGGPLQWYNGTSSLFNPSTLAAYTWYHFAFVRSGTGANQFTLYINGISVGTATDSTNYTGGTGNITIGNRYSALAGTYFTGYISNLRIVNGTAVYTSNFIPSTTPLTAIANTSLLTCQSNRFLDASSNNFALTPNGTPSVQRYSPFPNNAPYEAAYYGGSAYFDGTNDQLTVPQNDIRNTTFTFEFWMYPQRFVQSSPVIWAQFRLGTSPNGLNVSTDTGGIMYVNDGTTAGLASSSGAVKLNAWNHIAMTRDNSTGTMKLYINGNLESTATVNPIATDNLLISSYWTITSGRSILGYVTDHRLVRSTILYTANFTPPTAPLTAIANTSLLLNMTNAGITDGTGVNALTTVGNAQISTTQSKYGGASMYFDGTGDWLSMPISATTAIAASSPFTIECWVYLSAAQANYRMIISDTGSVSQTYISVNATGIEAQFGGSTSTRASCTTTLSTSTWYHIAVVRNSSNAVVIYVNGVAQTMTNTTQSGAFLNGGSIVYVGRFGGGTSYEWNGYIDDLRITNGVARYTANFTPPTSQLQNC